MLCQKYGSNLGWSICMLIFHWLSVLFASAKQGSFYGPSPDQLESALMKINLFLEVWNFHYRQTATCILGLGAIGYYSELGLVNKYDHFHWISILFASA